MPKLARRRPRKNEPAWDIAELYPLQGQWSEEEYLRLGTNRLVEFDDGVIEVLPVPTTSHQLILSFLFLQMLPYFSELGLLLMAGIRVRLWPRKYREPDIVFMTNEHEDRVGEDFWKGADLAIEIVSRGADNRDRDLREKRRDYAKGRILEYWTVDPQEGQITVYRLSNGRYTVHGVFKKGDTMHSARWPEFHLSVDDVFRAGRLR
jgi:Uma2 family endonuclease